LSVSLLWLTFLWRELLLAWASACVALLKPTHNNDHKKATRMHAIEEK
jgi:hypothetical protein